MLQKHEGWPVPVLPWMISLAVWRQQMGSCSTWLESIPSSHLHLKLFWVWMKPWLLNLQTSSIVLSDRFRRLLQVGQHSVLASLFLEAGLLPLSGVVVLSWRLHISFICCGCLNPDNHYPHIALQESKSLLHDGFPCWIADVNWVISHLPGGLCLPCWGHGCCSAHLPPEGDRTELWWALIWHFVKFSLLRSRLDLGMNGGVNGIVRTHCGWKSWLSSLITSGIQTHNSTPTSSPWRTALESCCKVYI